MGDELAKQVAGCMQVGDFTLSSGRKARYYADLRPLLFSPMIREIAARVCEKLLVHKHVVDAVGGPELTSALITAAVLAQGRPGGSRGFVVRKERKEHAKMTLIDGSLRRGDRIAVVDDVATSGASLLRAARVAEREYETTCDLAICVLDRMEGAAEHLKLFGIELVPLFTVYDLADKYGAGVRAE